MGVANPSYGLPGEPPLIPQLLTKDHKPEDPEEQENIRKLGKYNVTILLKGHLVKRVVYNNIVASRSLPQIPNNSVNLKSV